MKAKIAKPIKSIDLDQLEDGGLYFVLVSIFALQIIDSIDVNNTILPKLDLNTWSALLTFVFFFSLFRVLMKKVDDLRSSFVHDTDVGSSLNHQIGQLIKSKPALDTLDILATDTTNFYHALSDLHFHADRIRILLYSKTRGMEDIVGQWMDLKTESRVCNELLIRAYDMSPNFYGMIMDKSDGCFGFFYPGYAVDPTQNIKRRSMSPLVLDNHNPTEMKMLQDISIWFDQTFESSSSPVYSSLVPNIQTLE
ncbi:MAG: hypothetical protein ACOYZ6_11195 [Chloroflexota bacterium]